MGLDRHAKKELRRSLACDMSGRPGNVFFSKGPETLETHTSWPLGQPWNLPACIQLSGLVHTYNQQHDDALHPATESYRSHGGRESKIVSSRASKPRMLCCAAPCSWCHSRQLMHPFPLEFWAGLSSQVYDMRCQGIQPCSRFQSCRPTTRPERNCVNRTCKAERKLAAGGRCMARS